MASNCENDTCKPNARAIFRQSMAALTVSILSVGYGAILGWTSVSQSMLQSITSPAVGDEPFSDKTISWMGSVIFLGGFCGCFIWGKTADAFGRKINGYLISLMYIIGSSCVILANNSITLTIARFLMGVGISGVAINCQLYISEVASDSLKGPLCSLLSIGVSAGYLCTCVLGTYVSYEALNWYCFAVPVVYLVISVFWLLETPVYLMSSGEMENAKNVLLWYNGDNELHTNKQIKYLQLGSQSDKFATITDLFRCKESLEATIIGSILLIGIQFCGILTILTYTVAIFGFSGFIISPNISTIMIGILQLIASTISGIIINKTGRKCLLIFTYTIMSISLLLLSGFFYFQSKDYDMSHLLWLPIVCVSCSVICVGLGIAPVPYVLFSEIFEPHIRNLAVCIMVMIAMLASFAITKLYPLMILTFQAYGCFLFFSIFDLSMVIFAILFVSEPNGNPI